MGNSAKGYWGNMSLTEPIGGMSGKVPLSAAAQRGLRQVSVFDSFESAKPFWLRLEANGVHTPYQRFDWMAAIHASGVDRGRLVIAGIGTSEQPLALLPLSVTGRGGVRQARLVGSDYANSDWMMFDPAALPGLTLSGLQHIFSETLRQAGGIDIVRFTNVPAQWNGYYNPLLAFRHQPAPNNLYAADIGAVASPFIDHGITSKMRSNLRRGRARLEEQFGPVSVRRIVDGAALQAVHRMFLDQRGERFAQMGIGNIFATPEMSAFFLDLCRLGLGQARPAFVAHGLYAGEEIVATSFGAIAGQHYSQYINSTSAGPASKYSLMGILMGDLMDDLKQSGVTGFDMGTGDFAYKSDWTKPQTVFDSAMAVSARGSAVLPVLDGLVSLKRGIKQNPRVWALAQRVKKARYDLLVKLRR